jgi:hypothetical protein
MKNLDILEDLFNETKQKQTKLKSNWFDNLFPKRQSKDVKKLLKKLP